MGVILFGSALTLLFGLAQLHLQFALDDRARGVRRLQARRMELDSRLNALRSDVEELKNRDRLIEHARLKLDMREPLPGERDGLDVAADIKVRYREVRDAAETRAQRAPEPTKPRAVETEAGRDKASAEPANAASASESAWIDAAQ